MKNSREDRIPVSTTHSDDVFWDKNWSIPYTTSNNYIVFIILTGDPNWDSW